MRDSLVVINAQIRKLQAEQDRLRERQRRPALRSIVAAMRDYGITMEMISSEMAKGHRTTFKRTGGKQKPTAAAPKYRDPVTGATWSGRGRTPKWLTEAEAQGSSRAGFLISQATDQ